MNVERSESRESGFRPLLLLVLLLAAWAAAAAFTVVAGLRELQRETGAWRREGFAELESELPPVRSFAFVTDRVDASTDFRFKAAAAAVLPRRLAALNQVEALASLSPEMAVICAFASEPDLDEALTRLATLPPVPGRRLLIRRFGPRLALVHDAGGD